MFFKVFDGMGDPFGVLGFGFGFRQRRNGDDEVSFGDVDACTVVLGLIINLPCIRLCCLATVRLCRWVARPLPELRNGCLPWSDAGGGGQFVAMIRVFRYTSVGLVMGLNAGMNIGLNAGRNITLSAGKKITIQVGSSMILIDKNKISIVSKTIKIVGTKVVDIDGKKVDIN